MGRRGPKFESSHADQFNAQFCRVEESGRPRESHKLEIAGSNPASASNFAWVAQSVERRLADLGFCQKPCVDGSTPSPCTTTAILFNHFRKFNETKTKTPGHTKSLRRVGHEAQGWIASQTQQSDSSSREGEHSWGCSSKAEHSAFNRQARVRVTSSPPEHCRKRLIQLPLSRMFYPGCAMAAALVFNASAFWQVDLGPTWGTNFSHAQVAKRLKASDCKSDRETSREFDSRSVLHLSVSSVCSSFG